MTHRNPLRKAFTQFNLAITILLALSFTVLAQTISPDADPLTRLVKGNQRFVAGTLEAKDYRAERSTLTQAQHPYAIVLACADSRVPPELVFDESLGRLFVVRTAGHVVDPVALGSIEYAVEHLGVKFLFVLGHENCGAVKATIGGGSVPPNIKALLNRIQPAIDKTRAASVSEPQLLKRAVQENVRYQMQEALFESDVLAEFVHENKLKVSGGVYSLQTGAVEYLNVDLAVYRSDSGNHGEAADPHAAPANQHAPEAGHATEIKATPAKSAAPAHAAPAYNAKKAIHSPAHARTNHATEANVKPVKAAPIAGLSKHEAEPAHGREPAATTPGKVVPARAPAHTEAADNEKHGGPSGKKNERTETHSSLQPSQRPRVNNFAQDLLLAFAGKKEIVVKKATLMRDHQDRCATEDCRKINAGEKVKLESPVVTNVMGRPQIKVRYKGKPYFILAESDALAITSH